ncbi:MAG: hypothetical protein ACFKPT_26585 [Gloeotrichia echinulata GP01]
MTILFVPCPYDNFLLRHDINTLHPDDDESTVFSQGLDRVSRNMRKF